VDYDVLLKLVAALGWPTTLLVAIGVGVYKAAKYAGKKFFDEEEGKHGLPKGYFPRITLKHCQLVDVLIDETKKTTRGIEELLSNQKLFKRWLEQQEAEAAARGKAGSSSNAPRSQEL